jgi:hypothetical protein
LSLGITYSAGNRAVAANLQGPVNLLDLITVPLWTLTSTSASGTSSGTTETAVTGLTAPASQYDAHTAYRITMRGFLRAGTTSGTTTLRIRDTNAAGTLRFDGYSAATAVSNTAFFYETLVANTGGTAITGRVLAVTLTHSAAGGALLNASTQHPWYFRCIACGADADYPEAVAL